MAALTPVTPLRDGALNPGAAVASSDTINVAVMGPLGCYLEIINGGGSPDSVTISDAGLTPSGSPLTGGTFPQTVTNATSRIFFIDRRQVNPATQLVTITHSFLTSVTYKLYPH
jgi:hypothetical protein